MTVFSKAGNKTDARLDNPKMKSYSSDVVRRLVRNKLGMFGLFLVFVMVFSSVLAPLLTSYDYASQDVANRFAMPSAQHLFGTDNFGRDIFSRVLYGGRISLLVSLLALGISVIFGGALGAIAGYFGKTADNVIMRFIDILQAIPSLLMSVALSAMLGSGILNTALAVSIGGIGGFCKIVRATVLTIRDQEYIEASIACGSKNSRVVLSHIIPNCMAPVIVQASMGIGINILSISSLSFIGLGIQPPTPEWGSILNAGRAYIRDFWPIITFPGIAIVLTMFGFSVFGDALRDALDPKLKR